MREVIYVPIKATCPDGKVRTVRARATIYGGLYPDTAFTVPARAQVRGRTVTGFVQSADGMGWIQAREPGLEFVPVTCWKNHDAFVTTSQTKEISDDGR